MEVPQKLIVLVSGHKGAGKDTASKLLVNEYGFTRFAFADKLKDECSRCYNVIRDLFDDEVLKECPLTKMKVKGMDPFASTLQTNFLYCHMRTSSGVGPKKEEQNLLSRNKDNGALLYNGEVLFWTPRALAVHKGSSERTVFPHYWIDPFMEMIDKKGLRRLVVSDWRYTNEWKRILKIARKRGYSVMCIRIDDGLPAKSSDASETQLDDFEHFDFVFDNKEKTDVEKLYDQIRPVMPLRMCH
jgi:hypothetical protein